MKKSDLNKNEYPEYHGRYLEAIPDIDFIEALQQSESQLVKLLESISEEDANYRYQPGKWSIKELIIHLIDVERIFVYRALRFARNDFSKVPGFDQDDYVLNSNSNDRSIKSIIEEYQAQRKSTIQFFKNLSEEALKRNDPTNKKVSVRAAAYFISGHERHHTKILRERYLA